MLKKLIIISVVIACVGNASAQQEQQYSQYMVNGFVINPARAGTEDFVDLKLGYRNQWTGYQAGPTSTPTDRALSPRTIYLSGHSNIAHHGTGAGHSNRGKQATRHGIGGYIYDDQTFPIGRTGVYGAYAFNIPLNQYTRLSLGSFLGFKRFRVNHNNWDPFDPVEEDDLLLSGGTQSKIVPDGSLGAFLYSDYYFIGASLFQIFGGRILDQFSSTQEIEGRLARHYFITGGLRLPVSSDLTIIPSFALKVNSPAPVSIDANVMAQYGDLYFVGASARFGSENGDSFTVLGGITLWERFDVSYSYDITVSDLRSFHSGSHEVVLGYRIKHPYHIDCPGRKWH